MKSQKIILGAVVIFSHARLTFTENTSVFLPHKTQKRLELLQKKCDPRLLSRMPYLPTWSTRWKIVRKLIA